MFRRNVGGLDRVLRLTLGGILFLGGLLLLSGAFRFGVILVVVGLLALLTGIVGFCVLYLPFDVSTGRTGGASAQTSLRLCGMDQSNAGRPHGCPTDLSAKAVISITDLRRPPGVQWLHGTGACDG